MNKLHLLKAEDLHWQFSQRSDPYYYLANEYQGSHYEYVDPFPCYTHDENLVLDLMQECLEAFPVPDSALDIYILSHESIGRTNGWHSSSEVWRRSEEGVDKTNWPSWYSQICLLGKRTPIMHAMTRQLVPHEYGHRVDAYLQKKKGITREKLLAEYAETRGIELTMRYGAGHWHKHTGEIFANDFRILICKKEVDHWPHEVAHPFQNKAIQEWWEENK